MAVQFGPGGDFGLRTGPQNMRPLPVPIGSGSTQQRPVVTSPTVNVPSTLIGTPSRLTPSVSLTQPTIGGALPQRGVPVNGGTNLGTTGGMTAQRPGVLLPGTTSGGVVPGTTIPTTVVQQQPQQQGSWFDRLLGNTTAVVNSGPNGLTVGAQTQVTPGLAVGGATTIGPDGRIYGAAGVQQTPQYGQYGQVPQYGQYGQVPQYGNRGVTTTDGFTGVNSGTMGCIPNGNNGLVGLFDRTIGSGLKRLFGVREQLCSTSGYPGYTVPQNSNVIQQNGLNTGTGTTTTTGRPMPSTSLPSRGFTPLGTSGITSPSAIQQPGAVQLTRPMPSIQQRSFGPSTRTFN